MKVKRTLAGVVSATLLMLAAPGARADDKETIIIIAAVCGVALVGTGALAGGLAAWENGAADDVRDAAGRFRAQPSQANAREVQAARVKWQEAHDFNSTDDTYTVLVGTTGLLAGSMCLGIAVGLAE